MIENASGPRATVVPKAAGVAHVILAVEDGGTPSLTSYRRIVLNMRPATASEPPPPVDLTAHGGHSRMMGLRSSSTAD